MKKEKNNKKNEKIMAGWRILKSHNLFRWVDIPSVNFESHNTMGKKSFGKVVIKKYGYSSIILNESSDHEPEEWAFAIAHLFLHMAFGHTDADKMPGYNPKENKSPGISIPHWNIACDIVIDKFLREIKLGKPVGGDPTTVFSPSISGDEIRLYRHLIEHNIPLEECRFGMMDRPLDIEGLDHPIIYGNSGLRRSHNYVADNFAAGIAASIADAVSIAGGNGSIIDRDKPTVIDQAASSFLNHYPLLGGIAASFKIEQDPAVCRSHEVSIAAIDMDKGIIYANTARGYTAKEWTFVLAHEYLHAGLGHAGRSDGRDPYLWNVACDYVINGWLNEMGVGSMPQDDLLYDPKLKGESADNIYDMIISDIKRMTKSMTLRGYGKGDIIGNGKAQDGVGLDDFCKGALMQGLEYHMEKKRGFLPLGLLEEIRALSMPPIKWDVKLANWFDKYITPVEKRRSYAHPSRRQGSTPDIPRPRYVVSEEDTKGKTFGVIIDTSGSMEKKEIGKALGSVVSYSASKDVGFVRVVFCDADAYDAGYMSIEEMAGSVEVTGRGGTKLQPGVDLLDEAKDFPKDAPILLITDGYIERHMDIKRTHAFLIPKGNRLPFRARGEVFYYE